MNNGAKMKVDWSKIKNNIEFVMVDEVGVVREYYFTNGILYFINGSGYHYLSSHTSIDEVREDWSNIIERPIAYPNQLMKYIGCEVVLFADENSQYTYVTDVGEDWILTKYNGVIVRVYTDILHIVSLVNEDGSLVQLGKEEW